MGVSVISDSNNQVIASVVTSSSTYGVAYDSGKVEVFVTNTADGTVSVIPDNFSYQTPTQTTGSVLVKVTDSTGIALSGASVSSTSQPTGQTALSGTTDSDGSVTFRGVAAGAYMVSASKSG